MAEETKKLKGKINRVSGPVVTVTDMFASMYDLVRVCLLYTSDAADE